MGEGGQVPALHLVGLDPEPLPYDPALELGREEAVVAAQQEPGGHVGPHGKRPRLLEGRPGLLADVVERRRHQVGRQIVR